MQNRALSSLGLRLGSALLGLFLGAAGASLYAAETAAPRSAPPATTRGRSWQRARTPALTCDTCHESHEKYPHPANIPKPVCTTCHADQAGDYAKGVHGQARKARQRRRARLRACATAAPTNCCRPNPRPSAPPCPDTCGMCHTEVVEQYRASVHGQALARGITQAPLCTDCHGEHKILKHTNAASPVNAAHIRDTCGSCHGDVRLTRKFGLPADRLVSFDSSFHGLAAKSRLADRGQLRQLPRRAQHSAVVATPRATINAKNLPKTCGKCHPGAGTRFAISQVHVVGRRDRAGRRCAGCASSICC